VLPRLLLLATRVRLGLEQRMVVERIVVLELLQRKIVVKMLISALQLEVMLDRGSKQRTARSHPPSSRSVVTGTKRRRQVYQASGRSVR
jgi:hypothetical protein